MSERPVIQPENCPQPFWHDTHRYCPICTWVETPAGPMTTDNTAELIAAIRAREEAATDGPWSGGTLATRGDDEWRTAYVGVNNRALFTADTGWGTREDAEFIAHSREDIPFLLATVSALTVQLAEAESKLVIERGVNDGWAVWIEEAKAEREAVIAAAKTLNDSQSNSADQWQDMNAMLSVAPSDALVKALRDAKAEQREVDAGIAERSRPEVGMHINGSEYRTGKFDALTIVAYSIRAEGLGAEG